MEKLTKEVAEQQKVTIKAQSDCSGFKDTLKSSRDELKRLEKQATSVLTHFLLLLYGRFLCRILYSQGLSASQRFTVLLHTYLTVCSNAAVYKADVNKDGSC